MRKYTLTFTDRQGSKARYRAALKMMGAEDVRIVESEAEPAAAPKAKDNTPTSPEAKAVADLFGRAHEQPWSDAEITLFKEARKTGALSIENMKLITIYYKTERARGREGIHRRDLPVFLRNAAGELDRAKASKPAPSRALEWAASAKIIPIPTETRVDIEQVRMLRERINQMPEENVG